MDVFLVSGLKARLNARLVGVTEQEGYCYQTEVALADVFQDKVVPEAVEQGR
jgi:hypothetical protein